MGFMLNNKKEDIMDTNKKLLMNELDECDMISNNDNIEKKRKESFILFNSTLELVEPLNALETRKLMLALFYYNINGEIPTGLSKATQVAFNAIRIYMDTNNERYVKKSEAGKKGGAPKGNQNARKSPQPKPKQNESSSKDKTDKIALDDNTREGVAKLCTYAINQYNFTCGNIYGEIPAVADNDRILLFHKVITSMDEKFPGVNPEVLFKEIFQRMADSNFMSGRRSSSSWKAGFDWLLKDKNWEKVYLGKLG